MLMVFPEGTRVRKKNRGVRPKGGVAMMAIRAGAKLMPIYIGTKKAAVCQGAYYFRQSPLHRNTQGERELLRNTRPTPTR